MQGNSWISGVLKSAFEQNRVVRDRTESSDALLQSCETKADLEHEESMGATKLEKHQAGRNKIRLIFLTAISVLAKSLLIALFVWIVLRTFSSYDSFNRRPPALSCSCGGTTVAEAKARGCKFTPLSISWLPPHCIDQEISDAFDNAGPPGGWPYWADSNGTIPLTVEEVGMIADVPGGEFYTSQDWHITHCTYTWRKQFRAPATGVTIENRSSGLVHIAHCEKILKIRKPLEAIWTRAGIALDADTQV